MLSTWWKNSATSKQTHSTKSPLPNQKIKPIISTLFKNYLQQKTIKWMKHPTSKAMKKNNSQPFKIYSRPLNLNKGLNIYKEKIKIITPWEIYLELYFHPQHCRASPQRRKYYRALTSISLFHKMWCLFHQNSTPYRICSKHKCWKRSAKTQIWVNSTRCRLFLRQIIKWTVLRMVQFDGWL